MEKPLLSLIKLEVVSWSEIWFRSGIIGEETVNYCYIGSVEEF